MHRCCWRGYIWFFDRGALGERFWEFWVVKLMSLGGGRQPARTQRMKQWERSVKFYSIWVLLLLVLLDLLLLE